MTPASTDTPIPLQDTIPIKDIFDANRRLRRTVNLGNALEAPHEGDWGIILQEEYFRKIASASFTAVRIPISFSSHAAKGAPYTIDPAFLARVDWAVENAAANNLTAILDMHNYPEMTADPNAEKTRYQAIWRQIALHYIGFPDGQVFFELLNEPNDVLTDSIWNTILHETLAIVRQSNATRPVIVGASWWNSFDHLQFLQLPDDQNIIVTFHYYLPFEFTHQGAEWVDGSNAWLGTDWTGTAGDIAAIDTNFDSVANWASGRHRPIFLGEFGAYSKGDMASRVRWTAAVRQAAEQRGFSWGYWEFCSGFGIYDPVTLQWRQDLLQALVPVP